MSKLIHSPKECGYRLMGLCLYDTETGKVILSNRKPCKPVATMGKNDFPYNCPLQNGMPIPQGPPLHGKLRPKGDNCDVCDLKGTEVCSDCMNIPPSIEAVIEKESFELDKDEDREYGAPFDENVKDPFHEITTPEEE
jgi:hypothetical protein